MKKYLKYIVTLLLFGVVFLFVGEQSVIRRISRARQINKLEHERDTYQREIDDASRLIESLEITDTLEKFAREQYMMHTPGEKVYVIDD